MQGFDPLQTKMSPPLFLGHISTFKAENTKSRRLECPAVPGAGAEPEAEREVQSRGSGAERVNREVSILFVEFHECQQRFQVFCQYLCKYTKNLILRRSILGKYTINKKKK